MAGTEPEPSRYGRIQLAAAATLAVISLPYVFGLWDLFPTEASYYHHGPLEALWITAFMIAWIAFLGWLGPKLPGPVRTALTALSRAVTSVYAFHWIVIGWQALAVRPGSLGVYGRLDLEILGRRYAINRVSSGTAHVGSGGPSSGNPGGGPRL